MSTTGGKAFVDTNVLLRAMNPGLELHTEAEQLIPRLWSEDVELWISRQVIREYMVQVTRPPFLAPARTLGQVLAQLEAILSLFRVADQTSRMTNQLIDLIKLFPTSGKQIHDANIVAVMLVTQNIDDMKRFAPKISLIALTESA
jgi:predicted nucleic acid-binding protein